MKIVVHRLGADRRCSLCSRDIPETGEMVDGRIGEYMAVITPGIDLPETSYRIGASNREALCNGAPASEFPQEKCNPYDLVVENAVAENKRRRA